MRVLLLGFSSFAQRKLIPALFQLDYILSLDIASRHASPPSDFCKGKWYFEYSRALKESNANLAYISTMNHEHAILAEKCLDRGFHVIVDKPAALSIKEAESLVKKAESRELLLAESLVYPFHPAFARIISIVEELPQGIRHISANFSFPPLHKNNFRYKEEFGGGSLNDLGPYAVSPGRIFYKEQPCDIMCTITSHHENGIDTSFCAKMIYSKGRSFTGYFGFNTEYCNTMDLLGENFHIGIERVFTPPADKRVDAFFRQNNEVKSLEESPGDSIRLFLESVIDDIKNGSISHWRQKLLHDAQTRNALNKASREGESSWQ